MVSIKQRGPMEIDVGGSRMEGNRESHRIEKGGREKAWEAFQHQGNSGRLPFFHYSKRDATFYGVNEGCISLLARSVGVEEGER